MRKAAKYLARNAAISSLAGEQPELDSIRRVIVIPARGESAFLPLCLQSLAFNSASLCAGLWCIVVVNNPPPGEGGAEFFQDNEKTIDWLKGKCGEFPFYLSFINASSAGRELPSDSGVGLARKIGADSALAAFAEAGIRLGKERGHSRELNRILLHLDADTLVSPDYLQATERALQFYNIEAGVFHFEHRSEENPEATKAVELYELWMRCYVHGLKWAGSPYAFHSLGSIIVSTFKAYLRAGGISAKRTAGEDFYFLQQLLKNENLLSIGSVTVYPSGRPSNRVPFGTGPSVAADLNKEFDKCRFEPPAAFVQLRTLLSLVYSNPLAEAREILDRLNREGANAAVYFMENRDFSEVWKKFRQRCGFDRSAMIKAFNQWFDGLAARQLINMTSGRKVSFERAANKWAELSDIPKFENPTQALIWFRNNQKETEILSISTR